MSVVDAPPGEGSVAAASFVVIGVLTYSNTFRSPFLFDDMPHIVDNPEIRLESFSPSGIIKARKKEITQWGIDDLGVSAESVGLKGSPTIVSALDTLESKREVEILEGTRDEKVEQLFNDNLK